MTQILNQTRIILINVLLMFLIFLLPNILLPGHLGNFLAKMEISYEETWQEYLVDCDCTENLEELQ